MFVENTLFRKLQVVSVSLTHGAKERKKQVSLRGLPSITYAPRGGRWGGQHLCIQMRTRGEGGLNMTKSTHFVRRFIENATISETLKD